MMLVLVCWSSKVIILTSRLIYANRCHVSWIVTVVTPDDKLIPSSHYRIHCKYCDHALNVTALELCVCYGYDVNDVI